VTVFGADEVLVVEGAVRTRPGAAVDLLDVEVRLLLGDGDEVEIVGRVVADALRRATGRRREVRGVLVEVVKPGLARRRAGREKADLADAGIANGIFAGGVERSMRGFP
jgi:hypothetical protein